MVEYRAGGDGIPTFSHQWQHQLRVLRGLVAIDRTLAPEPQSISSSDCFFWIRFRKNRCPFGCRNKY